MKLITTKWVIHFKINVRVIHRSRVARVAVVIKYDRLIQFVEIPEGLAIARRMYEKLVTQATACRSEVANVRKARDAAAQAREAATVAARDALADHTAKQVADNKK